MKSARETSSLPWSLAAAPWAAALCATALCAAALCTTSLACTSPQAGRIGSQPSWRQPKEEPAPVSIHTAAPGSVTQSTQSIVLAPSTEGTRRYNDPPLEAPPSSPLGDALTEAIVAYHAETGTPPPLADGRLFRAASDIADVAPKDSPIPYALIEFALQRHGIIEPSPHLVVIRGPIDDPRAIMEQLGPRLPDILASGKFARFGVGMAREMQNGEGAAILALQSSYLTTAPIPRELPSGGTFPVEGRIQEGYRDPSVYVADERGQVKEIEVERDKRGGFRTVLSCSGRQGRQQVEVTASDASGSTVLANFPVWCNERAPTSMTVAPAIEDVTPVKTEEEAEAMMLRMVNEDRKAHNLPPLLWARDVTQVSRAHSEEMRRTGVVAHISPTTGSAADRVRRAAIETTMVLENVARAYSVSEAQSGLMNSPGHRANILSPLATHIGIGIVFGEVVAGRREMFVTQVFTRVVPPTPLAKAYPRIAEMLRTHPGTTIDSGLEDLARSFSADLAAGYSGDQASARAGKKLEVLAKRFKRVTTAVVVITDVETFDAASVFSDPVFTHYGLGVSKGNDPKRGPGALYVVVMLGQPH